MSKICMYARYKGRNLTPENIKETFSMHLEIATKEIKEVMVHQEVFDTIMDFKVYFKKIRQYKIVVSEDISKDNIYLKFL